MATAIQTWQIINEKLTQLSTTFSESGRKEFQDLEKWIKTNPEILGSDLAIIGEQVILTSGGRLDFLAIDRLGNLVIVELKGDNLSREALAQAIDYAAVLSSYDQEELDDICRAFTKREKGTSQDLATYLTENFTEIDFEEISLNQTQRILLVGFSIDDSLHRMIEWLSEKYGLAINAIALKYTLTAANEELLSRITIIPEEVEELNIRKKKFVIRHGSAPGTYNIDTLKAKLLEYLSLPLWSTKRLREIFLPALLQKDSLSRDEMKQIFFEHGSATSSQQAGYFLALISNQIRMEWNDFLRQVILWAPNRFSIVPEYRETVSTVLEELKSKKLEEPS